MAVSRLVRGAAAAGRHIPGSAGTAATRWLERLLQRGAGERTPLTWQQRQAMLPYFEDDIRLLEKITESGFRDWLQFRERSGGLVGARPADQGQARNGRVGNVVPLHGPRRAGTAGPGRQRR